ncbi:sulfotransferase [Evansella sp. AB-rgal1]|uniref:sulfotransferase n=1 Tax=Evansella sp. AB-rgal1 TaxID=3242696 RepID=UPI00359EF2D6
MKQNIIIYGASDKGKEAYKFLVRTYNVVYFCAYDESKAGSFVKGIKVLSTNQLLKYRDYKVIIVSPNYDEIVYELFSSGIYNIEVFDKKYYIENWKTLREVKQGPQFLGIGAQKSGTTWLYENLRIHPELYLPNIKELHYFNKSISRNINYWKFFEGNNRLKGEITPAYGILSYERIKYIKKILPNLKIILLLRNPIDRAWSHTIMHFTKFEKRSINEVSEREIINFMRSYDCIMRSNYLHIINNWKSVYPESQIFIGMYEDIERNPQKLLNDIFKFLGVKQQYDFTNFPYDKIIFNGEYAGIPSQYKKELHALYSLFLEQLNNCGISFT